jgi:hypothetical protein
LGPKELQFARKHLEQVCLKTSTLKERLSTKDRIFASFRLPQKTKGFVQK